MNKPEAPEDVKVSYCIDMTRMTKQEIDDAVIRTIEATRAGEVMSLEESIDRFCAMHNVPREKLRPERE